MIMNTNEKNTRGEKNQSFYFWHIGLKIDIYSNKRKGLFLLFNSI
jgi:hypothetical protein